MSKILFDATIGLSPFRRVLISVSDNSIGELFYQVELAEDTELHIKIKFELFDILEIDNELEIYTWQ